MPLEKCELLFVNGIIENILDGDHELVHCSSVRVGESLSSDCIVDHFHPTKFCNPYTYTWVNYDYSKIECPICAVSVN